MNKRLDDEGCELKKERGKMRGMKDRHEAFGARVAARNKTCWSLPASLNVTQAAIQKERWREEITHKKKKTFCVKDQGILDGKPV